MKKYFNIILYDAKSIKRDPTLLMLTIVPVIILFVLRLGVPMLANIYQPISLYYKIIIGLFSILNASFPLFLVTFLLLDEKDQNIFEAIKITPVSISGILLTRLAYMSLFSLFTGFLILQFNGFYILPLLQAIKLDILCVLSVPAMLLIMVTLAKNKVEGLTYLKAVNITIILPIAIFFVDTPFKNLLAILPAFWVFKFINTINNQNTIFYLGVVILLIYNFLSYKFTCNNILKK